MPVAAVSNEERRLALAEVVNALIADGLVPREEAERLASDRRSHKAGTVHPLVVIAEQKWRAAEPPHRLLTLEALTEWYAGKAGLPYFHVDPLKINFTAVTEVMSSAYAERFKILPVEVNLAQKRAVIATAEPYIREWETEAPADDIHIEPRRDMGRVRFRIDGVLHDVYQLPSPVIAAMTSRIKILGRMDVVEKRRPQDGRIKTRTADGPEVELRLSTLPTAFGEKLVMRIFDPEVLVKDFTDLGFSEEDKLRWGEMTGKPHGIILVTGPTGSGKTTTLYSTLKTLATSEVNVCTIEDPIEMIEPSFNQMQVQASIDLNFPEGVRALMRQDPDIIMVGEIRDLQTAEMAIQAALVQRRSRARRGRAVCRARMFISSAPIRRTWSRRLAARPRPRDDVPPRASTRRCAAAERMRRSEDGSQPTRLSADGDWEQDEELESAPRRRPGAHLFQPSESSASAVGKLPFEGRDSPKLGDPPAAPRGACSCSRLHARPARRRRPPAPRASPAASRSSTGAGNSAAIAALGANVTRMEADGAVRESRALRAHSSA